MNIVYLTADLGVPVLGHKGASVHVREFATALVKLRHHVVLVAANRGEGEPPPLGIEIRDLAPAERLNHPNLRDRKSITAHRSDEQVRAREHAALRVNGMVRRALEELHGERRIDLLYERYSLWSHAGARFARAARVPFVLEVNSPLVREQAAYRTLVSAETARRIERYVLRVADRVVAVSGELAQWVGACIGGHDKVLVLPNGVDLDLFAGLKTGPPSDTFVIGFLGSLKPWHGVDVLIDAFGRIAAEDPACCLLIVGDGPERGSIERTIAGCGLQSRVTLTGAVPRCRIPGELARMDVAVAPYPSIDEFYFSPLKVIEYMAAGRPIVASRIGQVASLLGDGETALLAKAGDAADLAAKIRVLREAPALAARLGRNARREAFEHHGWTKKAEIVLKAVAAFGADRARSENDAARPARRSARAASVDHASALSREVGRQLERSRGTALEVFKHARDN